MLKMKELKGKKKRLKGKIMCELNAGEKNILINLIVNGPRLTSVDILENVIKSLIQKKLAAVISYHGEDYYAATKIGAAVYCDIFKIRKVSDISFDLMKKDKNLNHKLDTDKQVFFYEQDFYVLSNFSAFRLYWDGINFDTSEAAYHYEKFKDSAKSIAKDILHANSAHEAFKIAELNKKYRRPDWDDVKVFIMKNILLAKVNQHEYVKRKLIDTGNRELIEDSWRDDFWGWGPNKDGTNMLGKLWMEIRSEISKK